MHDIDATECRSSDDGGEEASDGVIAAAAPDECSFQQKSLVAAGENGGGSSSQAQAAAAAAASSSSSNSNVVMPFLRNIIEPHAENDVIIITKGASDSNENDNKQRRGTQRFQLLVEERVEEYKDKNRLERPIVAAELVSHWRTNQNPPGTFCKITRSGNTVNTSAHTTHSCTHRPLSQIRCHVATLS